MSKGGNTWTLAKNSPEFQLFNGMSFNSLSWFDKGASLLIWAVFECCSTHSQVYNGWIFFSLTSFTISASERPWMEGIVVFPVVERDRESLFAQEANRNMIQKKKWKRRMKWANYFICYSDSLLKPHNFILQHYEQHKIVKAQNIHHERRNAKDK